MRQTSLQYLSDPALMQHIPAERGHRHRTLGARNTTRVRTACPSTTTSTHSFGRSWRMRRSVRGSSSAASSPRRCTCTSATRSRSCPHSATSARWASCHARASSASRRSSTAACTSTTRHTSTRHCPKRRRTSPCHRRSRPSTSRSRRRERRLDYAKGRGGHRARRPSSARLARDEQEPIQRAQARADSRRSSSCRLKSSWPASASSARSSFSWPKRRKRSPS